MLTQEQLVDIHVLHRQGLSNREIARRLGISRNTVKNYLARPTVTPSYLAREARPTKLGPYEAYLRERIKAAEPDWIPATVLFREIEAQGYNGGMTQLRQYVSQFKKPEASDPVVRFETQPGEQLQVDFTNINRNRRRMKGFVATLSFSRATFVHFSERERQEDWLYGLEEAFAFFGGVTQHVLFDNAKTIMIERDAYGPGQHRWNQALLEFAKYYGFQPRACRPYRARTKGKVERFNSYLKSSFITPLAASLKQHGLRFDVSVANAHIGPWLEHVAHQRIHGTTGEKPQILLEQERFHLQPLPTKEHGRIATSSASRPTPIESLQHPLSVYDSLLEGRL
ncbi:MAG: IS21 family transposase [Alcanivorax sp.]|nr:MAG: IS21 family transposase [Alcanivorax sp.]